MTVSGNLSQKEMEQLLNSQYVARLGCCENGKPYIVPVTFAFNPDGKEIIGVSGEGMKMNMIRSNPNVCVEVEDVDNISNWSSVIAWGKLEELSGADARNTLHEFVRKVTSLINDENSVQVKFLRDISWSSQESPADFVIYRIRIEEWSGRFERVDQKESIIK